MLDPSWDPERDRFLPTTLLDHVEPVYFELDGRRFVFLDGGDGPAYELTIEQEDGWLALFIERVRQ